MIKRITIFMLAVMLILTAGCSKITSDDGPAANYNNFTVYDNSNGKVVLSDIVAEGKPTVINYWTTWCPYCLKEMPDFEEVYKEYEGKVNFMMIDVNGGGNDDMQEAKDYIADQGYTFPVYFDTDLSATTANRVGSFPTTVIIDAKGNEIYNRAGMMAKESLIAFLEKAM